jgi:rhodanese-related sulfurtransferase
MRTVLLVTIVGLAAIGCTKSEPSKSDTSQGSPLVEENLPEVTIDEVDTGLAKSEWQAVDANGEGTRKKMGIVPGAVLLSDYETFAASELGTDKSKNLVFYCANTSCGASHEAASRARTAGYKNVKVMPDGIAGWVKAGKKVQAI